METTTPAQPERHIFARELHKNCLLLNSQMELGSLNESEIVQETVDLLELIKTSQPTNLVIDLSQSDYLGTVMLSAVLRLWKRIAERGGNMVLCNVSRKIVQVLRFSRLDTIWTICDSREQALHAVGG